MDKLAEKIEWAKYDAREYLGLYKAPQYELGPVLASAAGKYGTDVFTDADMLRDAMREAGAADTDIYKVCLMTRVTGFNKLLEMDSRTAQVDLDRYIKNAADETGFNRGTILQLTGSIAGALGIEMYFEPAEGEGESLPLETVGTLLTPLYRDELKAFKRTFTRLRAGKGSGLELDFDTLEPLVSVGIPKAKYYLGYCLLHGIQLERNEARGLELLEEAANAGDSEAAADLGDYYYEKGDSRSWTAAYGYYTRYGAAALDVGRKAAMIGILNQKRYNKKMLFLCIILLLISAATVLWPPAAEIFPPHRTWGAAALCVQAILLAVTAVHYRAKPYDCFYGLPVAMAGVWTAYMAVRLLF